MKSKGSDKIYYGIIYIILIFIIIITLYPFIYIVSSSVSDPLALARGEVWLFPSGFNLSAYKKVFEEPKVWSGYKNTLWYVFVGTAMNIALTTLTAYPLSRKTFGGRKIIMSLIAFTMFFSGGMVPTYLLVKDLNLLDTRWAMVLPAGISTWNLVIMRTFFEALPEELFESARIDGCEEIGIFLRIVLPLSGSIIAVMVLFYAVAHWNSYFSAMLYINRNVSIEPLQIYLRNLLIQFSSNESTAMTMDVSDQREAVSQSIRYATIMVSSLPIMLIYPFLQKYFIKGVMVGAVKG